MSSKVHIENFIPRLLGEELTVYEMREIANLKKKGK